jgi:stage II sporulation protein D
MLRNVYRFPIWCIAFFILVLSQTTPCQANEISVELVWKLDHAAWVEIDVEQGDYQLIMGTTTQDFPVGSTLQVGWGVWSPVLRINNEEYQLFKGSVLKLKENDSGSLRVKTPEGKAAVYRGELQLNCQTSYWQLINQVDSEDYLKGVVPIEMSNDWAHGGIEALKAQAVSARTFLVKHTLNGQKTITDSPDIDQAYAGKSVEGEASNAVAATSGEILVDDQSGQAIEALYSSHSGGYTEDAQNVWGNPDSHNVAHPDPFSAGVGGAENHWRFIVSAPVLGSTFGLGPVQNVKLDKFPSGRVKRVRLEDGFGHARTVTGRTFVKAFYPFGQPISSTGFLGSLFDAQAIKPSVDSYGKFAFATLLGFRESPELAGLKQKEQGPLLTKIYSSSLGTSADSQPFGVFIFEGRGWGHGVGMSQWGAYHMAQIGYNYKEILSFYYKNTLVRQS